MERMTAMRNDRAYIAKSRKFDCVSQITHDFVRTNKHLPPGQKLAIRLTRASDDFLLMTSTENSYHVKILDLKLYVDRISLLPNITSKIMQTMPLLLPSHKTEMRTFALPTGLSNKTMSICQGGVLPKTIVVGQVDTAALQGSQKTNPFHFRHNKVSRIQLRVNGTSIPSDGYSPNFPGGLVMREYNSMFLNTGMYRADRGNCITLDAFQNGSTLFTWDLTYDKCAMHHSKYFVR